MFEKIKETFSSNELGKTKQEVSRKDRYIEELENELAQKENTIKKLKESNQLKSDDYETIRFKYEKLVKEKLSWPDKEKVKEIEMERDYFKARVAKLKSLTKEVGMIKRLLSRIDKVITNTNYPYIQNGDQELEKGKYRHYSLDTSSRYLFGIHHITDMIFASNEIKEMIWEGRVEIVAYTIGVTGFYSNKTGIEHVFTDNPEYITCERKVMQLGENTNEILLEVKSNQVICEYFHATEELKCGYDSFSVMGEVVVEIKEEEKND